MSDESHSVSPVHSHAKEQWGVCLDGEWIRIQDCVEHHVGAGEFWQTPGHVPHGERTLDSGCVVLDIFAPPREEYRQAGSGLGSATFARRAAARRRPAAGGGCYNRRRDTRVRRHGRGGIHRVASGRAVAARSS
jgi:Cupin domain